MEWCKGGSTVVGSDTYIVKDVRTEKEVDIAGKRIE